MKVAVGAGFHPSRTKLELITGVPPLDIIVKLIAVKFILKALSSNHHDLLRKRIIEIDNWTGTSRQLYKHSLKCHIASVKQYLRFASNNCARTVS